MAPSPVAFADVDVLFRAGHHAPAAAARIRQQATTRRIPLVLCSTRTRAELECLQRGLGLPHPFICESGAAVYVPHGYFNRPVPGAVASGGYEVVRYGPSHEKTVAALRRSAAQLGMDVVGFSDLSIEEVAMECGLSLPQARLAKMRECGEPFKIAGAGASRRAQLFRLLKGLGFGCTSGGRFDYVGAAVDEVAGIRLLRQCYERAFGPIVTVGVGDPVRDARLLSQVEIPIEMRLPADRSPEYVCKPATSEFDPGVRRPALGQLYGWLAAKWKVNRAPLAGGVL